MVTGKNDLKQALGLIGHTLEGITEIYKGHLSDLDKCKRIIFLAEAMVQFVDKALYREELNNV